MALVHFKQADFDAAVDAAVSSSTVSCFSASASMDA